MKNGALNSALTALLFLSMILSAYSCSEEVTGSDKSKENSERTEVISAQANEKQDIRKYVKDKYELPRDIVSVNWIKKSNEKLYFNGIESRGYPQRLDIRSKKLDTDYYYELNASRISKTLTANDKRYVVYCANYTSNMILCSVNLSDGKLIKKVELPGANEAEAIHLDANGNIRLISVTNQKEASISVYSSDLELLNSVNITENLQLCDNEKISKVLHDGNGSYYFSIYQADGNYNTLCRINSTGELVYKSSFSQPEYHSICQKFVAKNRNLFIASDSSESESLKLIEISNDTGEKINEYEIPGIVEKNRFYLISEDTDNEYDFIYETSKGIFGYTLADNISTEIINFSEYPEIKMGYEYTGENEFVTSPGPASSKYNCICVYNENNIAGQNLCNVSVDMFTQRSAVSDDGFIYSYTYDSVIDKINDSGEVINSFDCKELISENNWVYKLLIGSDNKIYIRNEKNQLLVLNDDGTKFAEIQLKNNTSICDIVSSDKTDYLIFESGDELKIEKIDFENKKLDENTGLKNIDLHNAIYNSWNFQSGSPEYDFYYMTNDGLFGCLVNEDKTDKLLDFAEHEINSEEITVYWIDENEIIYKLYNKDRDENGYYHLKMVE